MDDDEEEPAVRAPKRRKSAAGATSAAADAVWVACDRCEKWRRLPDGPEYEEAALPEQWFCYMNPNTQRNTCEKPEERMERNEIWEEGDEEAEEEEEEGKKKKKKARAPHSNRSPGRP